MTTRPPIARWWRRFYFFEIASAANLAVLVVFAWDTVPIIGSPLVRIYEFSLTFVKMALIGIVVRSVIALVRRRRAYFRAIWNREWMFDTLRMILAGGIFAFTYAWIKITVPIYHPVLFDQQLWDLDQLLFFGFAPTVLFLDLFGTDTFLRVVDWSYAGVFIFTTYIAFAYFLSEPSRRVRIAFANGNAAMWIIGAWLYLLVPSLGPAYRFPEIWQVHSGTLRLTQNLQALLMRNYQNVLRAARGEDIARPINIIFGIAAFPSLHVGFQVYVFLWMRRLWKTGEVLFAISVLTIFLGSMITGWHYFIDGLAGVVIAYGCYRISWSRARLTRWTEIRSNI